MRAPFGPAALWRIAQVFRKARNSPPTERYVFASFPEVKTVVSEVGRPDDGTDTGGFGNTEYFVDLKPKDQWRPVFHQNKEELIAAMNRAVEKYPGAIWNFSQPIEDNVGETMTGTKGSLALKIFGDDLKTLEQKGEEVTAVMSNIPGMHDVKLLRDFGQPNLDLTIDRRQAARFGINVTDIQDAVQTAVGGNAVSQVLIGEQRYDVVVRYQAPYRNTATGHRESSSAFSLRRARFAGAVDQRGSQGWRVRHLPRRQHPLCGGDLQRERPRSRNYGRRRDQTDRRKSETAAGLQPRLVRRIRERKAGGSAAGPDRSSDDPRHLHHSLHHVSFVQMGAAHSC